MSRRAPGRGEAGRAASGALGGLREHRGGVGDRERVWGCRGGRLSGSSGRCRPLQLAGGTRGGWGPRGEADPAAGVAAPGPEPLWPSSPGLCSLGRSLPVPAPRAYTLSGRFLPPGAAFPLLLPFSCPRLLSSCTPVKCKTRNVPLTGLSPSHGDWWLPVREKTLPAPRSSEFSLQR